MRPLSGNLRDAHVALTPNCGSGISAAGSCPLISQPVHQHVDVLSVKISAVNMDSAVELALQSIESGDPEYVCAASVHGVMEAQRDPGLLSVFNKAAINIPDGMPLTWVGWLQGFTHMDRVFGPDFMLQMCRISVSRGYRHFLYGGNPGVADELSGRLQKMFPGLQIAGTFTPPFRSLNPEEERDVVERISRAKPHILWVGIGAPKQERFMAEYVGRFSVPLMVGVGAAFDFHTGRIADCPEWVKRAGLQWLHRLKQEPGRLWKRYLVNNPVFLWRVAWQLIGRSFPRRTAVDRPSRAMERSAGKSADLKT